MVKTIWEDEPKPGDKLTHYTGSVLQNDIWTLPPPLLPSTINFIQVLFFIWNFVKLYILLYCNPRRKGFTFFEVITLPPPPLPSTINFIQILLLIWNFVMLYTLLYCIKCKVQYLAMLAIFYLFLMQNIIVQ